MDTDPTIPSSLGLVETVYSSLVQSAPDTADSGIVALIAEWVYILSRARDGLPYDFSERLNRIEARREDIRHALSADAGTVFATTDLTQRRNQILGLIDLEIQTLLAWGVRGTVGYTVAGAPSPFPIPPPLDLLGPQSLQAECVELLAQPVIGEPPKTPTKCNLEHVFTRSVIELMKAAPKNETVHALILSITGLAVPPCETFEQLKDYIESNFTYTGMRVKPEPTAFVVEIDCEGVIRGTCNYERPAAMRGQFRISSTLMDDFVGRAVGSETGMSELCDDIAGHISRNMGNQITPDVDTTTARYHDYTVENQSNYFNGDIHDALHDFIKQFYPEEYETFVRIDQDSD